MQIEYWKTERLIPYENNPRNNDGAVDAVAESIKEFGFKVPIVVDKDGVIIAGHTRLKAAQKLGMKEIPVIRAYDLTDEQAKALRLADNKTGELAEWDFELLKRELDGVSIGMERFGFLVDEIRKYDAPKDEQEKKNKNARDIVCPRCGKVVCVKNG